MKKWIFVLLFTLLVLVGCGRNENLQDCVLSAERAVWGDRIYSIQSVPDKGVFLTYTEIGDEEQTVYVGCIDPLCSHDKKECTAFSDAPNSQIALVPQNKGFVIYFFRTESFLTDPDDPRQGYSSRSDLLAMDMKSGKCRIVTSLPFSVFSYGVSFLVTDTHVYFTLNSQWMQIESDVQQVNIWRTPLTGGEPEQCTFGESAFVDNYRVEHYENGVFYYRCGETLCRTTDEFATEEVVMEGLNNMWKIMIHNGWVYYTDEREVISLTPDEPKPEGREVYGYAIGQYPEALDAANTCTLMRTKLDGSGTTEKLISGIWPRADWCIVEDTLYCVPAQFELQGKIEWSNSVSKNALTYIWSESGGELWAVDLNTKEKRVVLSDLGYDISTIEYTGKGKFLVSGRVYDIDTINKHYETNYVSSSNLKYTVWELLDIE